jgi:hypothetical protein
MSLQPQPPFVVPPDTARIARAIYPKGNLYMQVFDALGGELLRKLNLLSFTLNGVKGLTLLSNWLQSHFYNLPRTYLTAKRLMLYVIGLIGNMC